MATPQKPLPVLTRPPGLQDRGALDARGRVPQSQGTKPPRFPGNDVRRQNLPPPKGVGATRCYELVAACGRLDTPIAALAEQLPACSRAFAAVNKLLVKAIQLQVDAAGNYEAAVAQSAPQLKVFADRLVKQE